MKKLPRKELWQTVFDWLVLSDQKINKPYCRDEMTTHPDYPSLISAIDFLDTGAANYEAVSADASYIREFNYPLLAHLKEPGQEYMYIVKDVSSWDIDQEVTQHWTGVVVYLHKGSRWVNEENKKYTAIHKANYYTGLALAALGVLAFVVSSAYYPNVLINSFGAFSLLGLITSIFALGAELGFQNKVVKQVCGSLGNETGCNTVLTSQYAKGFAGITPADLSVFYFGTQFIFYLAGCRMPFLFPALFYISLGGILVAALSVYTQAVKLKQWCALCLGIAAVLAIQTIMATILFSEATGNTIPALGHGSAYLSITLFILSIVLLSAGFLPIKRLIKKDTANKLKLTELKKWKLDGELFVNLWKRERQVDTTVWDNDLLLGTRVDPATDHQPLLLTVACNTYCGPCAQMHQKLNLLSKQFEGKLNILVRFLCDPADETHKVTAALKVILQLTSAGLSPDKLEHAITDWFDTMNYEEWVAKWQPDLSIDVHERLLRHSNWINDSQVSYTPDLFLNGRKIPNRYTIEDLQILIPQLIENELVTGAGAAAYPI